MKEVLEGLLAIENVANTVSCERDDVNRAILLALLCGEHCLIYGPPGCLHANTPIHDPVDGTTLTVRERYLRRQNFHVTAVDFSGKYIVAKANRPYRYPMSEMVRFTTDTGETITVTKGHKFWTGTSYVRADSIVEVLRKSGVYQLQTISDNGLSAIRANANRCSETTQGSQNDCPVCHRFCGEQLHEDAGISQDGVPSQVCANGHALSQNTDATDSTREGSLCRKSFHRSTPDSSGLCRSALKVEKEYRQCSHVCEHAENLFPVFAQSAERSYHACTEKRQSLSLQESTALKDSDRVACSNTRHRSVSDRGIDRSSFASNLSCEAPQSFSSLQSPCVSQHKNSRYINIVKWESAGSHNYYDFEVPVFHNYHACGMFHHNTAKSMTARLFLSGVNGCKTFIKQMTRQMPEEAVFGPLDIPRWRKEGVYIFKLEGGLAQAQLALLNEIYDSSDALLRSLLEVLNEREFSRSLANVIKCPLHTCIATSNFFRNEGDAQAVSDRFLIRIQVDPLEEAKNRVLMLQNTLEHGRTPEIDDSDAVNFAALKKVSAAIAEVEVPSDVLELYEKVYADYKSRSSNKFLSDRRFAWSLRLIQAGAFLDGRTTAIEADIAFAKYGLVFVGKQSEEDAWTEATANVLKFVEEFDNIKTFSGAIEKVRRDLKRNADPAKLPDLHRKLTGIREGLSTRTPTSNSDVEKGYTDLGRDLDTLIQECVNKITPEAMSSL